MTELYTDINKITADLQLKAEKDLSNVGEVSQQFKETSVGWGMPDYSAGVSVYNGFVCPSDGAIRAFAYDNGAINYNIYDSNNAYVGTASASANISQNNASLTPVFKNYRLEQERQSGNNEIYFYPFKGAN